MDTVYTTLLDTVCTFLFTETWRVGSQCVWKFFFVVNRVDEFTDHGMFAGTDQVKILALDLVHHRIHLVKAHNARNNVASDHKRRNDISKSTVDHEITRIGNHCRMKARDITHQIIETVSCNFSCRIKINTIETLHDVCVIWDFEIRYDRIAKFFDLYIAAVIFSDRYGRIDDVRDRHHDPGYFLLQFFFLLL